MLGWLASACAVAALFQWCRRRQPVPEAEDTQLRPMQRPRTLPAGGIGPPSLTDEERREAAALELVNALLQQIAKGCSSHPAAQAARVQSRDESCPVCTSPGHAFDGNDPPPANHSTRYSAEVRSFASYRDLYQPD
jgi:hypothetical protein